MKAFLLYLALLLLLRQRMHFSTFCFATLQLSSYHEGVQKYVHIDFAYHMLDVHHLHYDAGM